jgi:hypothetical protein
MEVCLEKYVPAPSKGFKWIDISCTKFSQTNTSSLDGPLTAAYVTGSYRTRVNGGGLYPGVAYVGKVESLPSNL